MKKLLCLMFILAFLMPGIIIANDDTKAEEEIRKSPKRSRIDFNQEEETADFSEYIITQPMPIVDPYIIDPETVTD